MKTPVKAPSVGESITEVSILKWHKENGQAVKNGEIILEIESDKATVEIVAEGNGVLRTFKSAGDRIPVGEIIGEIDSDAQATVAAQSSASPSFGAGSAQQIPPARPAGTSETHQNIHMSPAVQKLVTENNLNPSSISGTGKDARITKGDVLEHLHSAKSASPQNTVSSASTPTMAPKPTDKPGDRRVPMSMLRAKIAERLVHAQHTAAILTTFNEVDLTAVMALRAQHKDNFKAKYGVSLSFMSFFTRACVQALQAIPEVNASIDGKDIVYHDYYDVGIAVGTERGLVVPVLRNTDKMTFVDIEKKIAELALKGREGKLSIADLTGGTFTISNGGTYGSLMSTPILNPPQSGILGMHKIQERPMAVQGKIEIRPMMYLALSYDHRIIDGKGAVTFLVKIKEALENPTQLQLDFI